MSKYFLIFLQLFFISSSINAQKIDTCYLEFESKYFTNLIEIKKLDSDYSVFDQSKLSCELQEKIKDFSIQGGYLISYINEYWYRADVSYFVIDSSNSLALKKMIWSYYESMDHSMEIESSRDFSTKNSVFPYLLSATTNELDEYIKKKGTMSEVFMEVTPTLLVRFQFFKNQTYREGSDYPIESTDENDFRQGDLEEFIKVKNKFLLLYLDHLHVCRDATTVPRIAAQTEKITPKQLGMDATVIYDKLEFEKAKNYQPEGYYKGKGYVEYIQYVANNIVKSPEQTINPYQIPKKKQVLKFYPDMATFEIINSGHYTKILARDKKGIYFKGKLVTADTSLVLPAWGRETRVLWKTKTHVFVNDSVIKVDDVFTFRPAMNNYQTDTFSIYDNTVKIENSHGPSFQFISNQICYDKNNVYLNGKQAFYKGLQLIPVNARLAKTENTVILLNSLTYSDTLVHASELPDINAKTLVGLSENFSKDKNHIYYGTTPIPLTTQQLNNLTVWDQYNSLFFSDGKNIFTARGFKLPLEHSTFGIFPRSDVFFDQNGIYSYSYSYTSPLPFSYTKPVSDATSFFCNPWVIYLDQAYNISTKRKIDSLSEEDLVQLRKGHPDVINKRIVKTEKWHYNDNLYAFHDTIFFRGQYTTADFPSFRKVADFFIDTNHVYNYSNEKGLVILDSIDRISFKEFMPLGYDNEKILWTDKNYLYYDTSQLISSTGLKILGHYRPSSNSNSGSGGGSICGNEPKSSTEFYLVQNKDGKWLIKFFSGNEYYAERYKVTFNKVVE